MRGKKTLTCIIPASSSASKKSTYFEVYKKIFFEKYSVIRLLVLFPLSQSHVFVNAADTYASYIRTKVTPLPMSSVFDTTDGIEDVLRRAIPHIVADNPDEVAIVTSGGTTKMGHTVEYIGDAASQLGWEVFALWVAKPPNGDDDYSVTYKPRLKLRYGKAFNVSMQTGDDGIPDLIIERGEEYGKIYK